MPETSQFILLGLSAVFGSVGGALGAYVAIRADLAGLKAVAEMHGKSLDRAHIRIDNLQGSL
ncbi:MAG: hypothetical protein IPO08_23585 [Xanthomonadales bacterium]|nr:hypothetical protein [Xanthomonadales bacterium]